MVVPVDQGSYQADVVFVIEGTANISPYVDTLKRNYIIPTLEYFNGAPIDDRDFGCDANSTMYALVVFFAADRAPETAAICFGPTANTHKFLSWFDKLSFIGGGGESHSHIAEGLSTALQCFDDFQTYRENNSTTKKHCILISNSPPYALPALESSSYYGLVTEQLASLLSERQINLSVLSPRKIPVLFKIYEKAGGDLQHALAKNYAKDRRHLVLLRGFQLQERPVTPPAIDSKSNIPVSTSACSPPGAAQKRPAPSSPPHGRDGTGFKQPATQSSYSTLDWPASESQATTLTAQNSVQSSIPQPVPGQSPLSYGQSQMPGQLSQTLPQRPGIPTPPASHLNPLNQPNPPNVTITQKGPPTQHSEGIRPTRNHSPVPPLGGPRMPWNQPANPSSPVSTPPTTSVLATQLNMPSSNMPIRHNAPQMQNMQPGSNIVSQAQNMNPIQGVVVNQSNMLRSQLPNIGIRMSNTSPGPVQNAGANPLAVQLGQHQTFGQTSQPVSQQSISMANSMPSTIQSKLANATTVNQMQTQHSQAMTTTSASNITMPQTVPGMNTSQQNQPQANPSVATKDRCTIWQGILEFHEKSPNQPQAQRVSHSLPCTFSSMVTNGDPDVNADKWPNRLMLQLIPRQLIAVANLFNILKTAARHVLIHFNQESEALSKLCKIMSSGLVGCIQFHQNCDIRIMVVLYMPDKKIYMGFIANDQDSFFHNIRQMYENHRKQQQKQRMQQMGTNIAPSDGMVLPSSTASNQNIMMPQASTGNMPAASNTQINPRMPINQPLSTNNQPPPQAQAPNATVVHSTSMNQQQPTLTQAARLSQLEAARQQNLLKIQQLQQTLEAAQQKELQFKAAQEQQQQQQHQHILERQNAIRQLQQQLQHQQQQLDQATAQQRHQQQLAQAQAQVQAQAQAQATAQQQQGLQMHQVNPTNNPQLRTLLQQQAQQQMRRQQQQQSMQAMMQQHPQSMRPQLQGNIQQGGINSSVGQQQQNQQQSWDNPGILDLLPP